MYDLLYLHVAPLPQTQSQASQADPRLIVHSRHRCDEIRAQTIQFFSHAKRANAHPQHDPSIYRAQHVIIAPPPSPPAHAPLIHTLQPQPTTKHHVLANHNPHPPRPANPRLGHPLPLPCPTLLARHEENLRTATFALDFAAEGRTRPPNRAYVRMIVVAHDGDGQQADERRRDRLGGKVVEDVQAAMTP